MPAPVKSRSSLTCAAEIVIVASLFQMRRRTNRDSGDALGKALYRANLLER
jgi:hypothetical protein